MKKVRKKLFFFWGLFHFRIFFLKKGQVEKKKKELNKRLKFSSQGKEEKKNSFRDEYGDC